MSTASPYLGFFIFNQPFLLIRDLKLIKKVLITDFDHFADRIATTSKKDTVGSKILFLLKGDEWKELRKTSSSWFSPKKLKRMVPLINEIGDNLVRHLEKHLDKDSTDCRSIGQKFAIDVMSSCAFGLEANALLLDDSVFVKEALKLFEVNLIRGVNIAACLFSKRVTNLFNFTFFDVDATTTLSKMFNNVCEDRRVSGKIRGDFIDILNKKSMHDATLSDEYLSGLAIGMLVAGNETSGSIISYILYELCRHSDVQNRLREEVENVVKDNDGNVCYEAINEMTYMDMVIMESLRKYPVLGFVDRRCVKNYKIPGSDLIIEKGTPIVVPIYALHYDERYYPDPQRFDPERFSPDNNLSIPRCAYLPFGEGMRQCVGMRLAILTVKMCIIKSILNFKIEICDDTPKSIKFDPISLLLRPHNNEIKLKFVRI
ncbi:hypothetical protein FQR65_LT06154 [Abscondita terminalis]|nr:hypothetical protein FQR65_LT06154 [Abscondita terminalis]